MLYSDYKRTRENIIEAREYIEAHEAEVLEERPDSRPPRPVRPE